MFEITIGVPLPKEGTNKSGIAATLHQMAVGDSFHVSAGLTTKNRLSSAFAGVAKTKGGAGKRFAQRKMPDGFRVWRIA